MTDEIKKVKDINTEEINGIEQVTGRCPACTSLINMGWNGYYCGDCGQKVEWKREMGTPYISEVITGAIESTILGTWNHEGYIAESDSDSCVARIDGTVYKILIKEIGIPVKELPLPIKTKPEYATHEVLI